MKALGVPAALLVGLTLAALFVGISVEDVHGDPQLKYVFAVLLVLSAGAYAWAVRIVVREPGNAWLVLGVALLLRGAVLLAPPFLSSDMYRYVWDGMVQNSGISPYAYVPIDPALEALQDAAIYPNINRVEYAHTIYPPAAQMLFAAVAWLSPTILAMKAAMLGFEALAMLCALRLLQDARLPASRLAIYAWNPLAIWEFSGNGHVDAAATGCIALALLLRARRRDGLAGLALAAAILVKFLPAIVVPALWRRGGWWRLMA